MAKEKRQVQSSQKSAREAECGRRKQVGRFVGRCFHGYEERPLYILESRRRNLVTSGTMLVPQTKRILDRPDSEVRFGCRLERKVTGANIPLHRILNLKCACAPDRLEWLFSNLRWRHSLRPGLTATVCGTVICWHSPTEFDTSKLNV